MNNLNIENYVKSYKSEFYEVENIKSYFHLKSEIKKSPGIYFLLSDDNEIVYIGSSKYPYNRINQHSFENKKIFSNYHIHYIDEFDIGMLEYYEYDFILKYRPKYNITISHHRWMTIYAVLSILNNDSDGSKKYTSDEISNIIKIKKVNFTIFNEKILYDSKTIFDFVYDINNLKKAS